MKHDISHLKLEKLNSGILCCRKCPLNQSRTHAVPGEGPCASLIAFIGEAPGKEEDLQGRPFVGRSGTQLNRILSDIGLSREKVFITSSVKCRPPRNRNPHSDELKTCKRNWLDRQITIINPRIVVLLGKVPLKQVLEIHTPLSKIHGNIFTREARMYLSTYHPAAAMRNPEIKKKMKNDMRVIVSVLT